MKLSNILLGEELIESTYEILFEIVDPSNHYDFQHERKNLWIFIDKNKIKHFLIINKSLYKEENIAEVKFGWIDNGEKLRYDRPPHYDERVFNTHIYLFIHEILSYYGPHFKEFHLDATDPLRHRLYRQTLSKFLDKGKFSMEDNLTNSRLIIKSVVY